MSDNSTRFLTFNVVGVSAILLLHLLLSFTFATWPLRLRSIIRLLATSLGTSLIWMVLAVYIYLGFAMSSHASDLEATLPIFKAAIGVPLSLSDMLTWLPPLSDSSEVQTSMVYGFLCLMLILFALSLLLAPILTKLRVKLLPKASR